MLRMSNHVMTNIGHYRLAKEWPLQSLTIKRSFSPLQNVATTLRRKTAISYGSFPRHIYLLMRAKFYPDQAITMSTASGATDFCKNISCEHANNEHKIRACRAPGCRVKWKRCQVAGKCNGVHYRICKKCPCRALMGLKAVYKGLSSCTH